MNHGRISLSQGEYIKDIVKRYKIDPAGVKTPGKNGITRHDQDDDLPGNKDEFQSIVGSLLYAVKNTRPDISNAAREISRHVGKPTKGHYHDACRVLQYLAGHQQWSIAYDRTDELKLTAYVDSDYANDMETRRSVTGYVIMLGNGPIQWKSQLQKTVRLSSSEAEYKALSECAKEVMFLKRILEDLGVEERTVAIYEDNVGAMNIAENNMASKRTKHIDVRYHHIRELVEKGEIEIRHLSTEKQPADMFTKNLPRTIFEKHKRFVMNLD